MYENRRPFVCYPKPLFQSKANINCKAIYMEMIFYSHANKLTHFCKIAGFALSLILKVTVFGTGK